MINHGSLCLEEQHLPIRYYIGVFLYIVCGRLKTPSAPSVCKALYCFGRYETINKVTKSQWRASCGELIIKNGTKTYINTIKSILVCCSVD